MAAAAHFLPALQTWTISTGSSPLSNKLGSAVDFEGWVQITASSAVIPWGSVDGLFNTTDGAKLRFFEATVVSPSSVPVPGATVWGLLGLAAVLFGLLLAKSRNGGSSAAAALTPDRR